MLLNEESHFDKVDKNSSIRTNQDKDEIRNELQVIGNKKKLQGMAIMLSVQQLVTTDEPTIHF